MRNNEIVQIAGYCLLALGGVSGLALFLRAAFGSVSNRNEEAAGTGTLWGLFLIGTLLGLGIIAKGC